MRVHVRRRSGATWLLLTIAWGTPPQPSSTIPTTIPFTIGA